MDELCVIDFSQDLEYWMIDDLYLEVIWLVKHAVQGCAGRPFIPRGGAKVKIHGAGRGGAKVKIRGAGRGEKARKSTNSKILQKCEKCNITYYNIKDTRNCQVQ